MAKILVVITENEHKLVKQAADKLRRNVTDFFRLALEDKVSETLEKDVRFHLGGRVREDEEVGA
jgi:uncharacterized protein (DUF1778 family)